MTIESLSQPTKRIVPAEFHALTRTVGLTARRPMIGPSEGVCCAAADEEPQSTSAAMESSARIFRSLQQFHLLPIGLRQQLSQRRVPRIVGDRELELLD